jgi:hypothetical protein
MLVPLMKLTKKTKPTAQNIAIAFAQIEDRIGELHGYAYAVRYDPSVRKEVRSTGQHMERRVIAARKAMQTVREMVSATMLRQRAIVSITPEELAEEIRVRRGEQVRRDEEGAD